MGKIFATLILAWLFVWLVPMCAQLPADLSTLTGPVAAPAPAPVPVPVPEPIDEVPPTEPAPAAVVKPLPDRPVTVSPYRSRKMFPMANDKYLVSVIRANRADRPAVGARMTVTARLQGRIVEQSKSGPGQTLAPGSTSYFGLNVSTVVFDTLIDGPEDRNSGLEWELSYHFEDDAPGTTRCFRRSALPRHREPTGITWLALGESQTCRP